MCVHRWLFSVLLDVLEMLQEMREGRPLEKGDKVFLNWNEKVEQIVMISLFLLAETASRELCLRWIQIHQRRQLKAVMAVSHQKQGGLINTEDARLRYCTAGVIYKHVVLQVPKHVDKMWSRGILGERHQGSVRHSMFLRCEESHASSGITD